MDLLVIYKGKYPHGLAMTKRLHLYCKGLSEAKHSIKIVVPVASESFGHPVNYNVDGMYEGVSFQYLSKSTIRSRYFFKRRIDDWSGYIKLCFYLFLLKDKPKSILIVDLRNSWRFIILLIAAIRRIKVIYEVNEHPILLINSFLGVKIGYWIETRILYPLFDGFIVISRPLEELIIKYKGSKASVIKIPIITSIPPIEKVQKREGLPYIFHSGSLSEAKDGIFEMLKAFAIALQALDYNIRFYITGTAEQSRDCAEIKSIIEKNNLTDYVVFLGYISPAELEMYMQNCCLTIINKNDNLQNRYCFPTKLGEYASYSKPIIMKPVGELTQYFTDNKNAYFIPMGTPEMIAHKIIDIVRNPELAIKIGTEARKLAEREFNYSVQAKRMIGFLNTLEK